MSKIEEIQEARGEFQAANPSHDPLTTLVAFNLLNVIENNVAVPDDPSTAHDETVKLFDLGSFAVEPVGDDRVFLHARLSILTADGTRRTYLVSMVPEALG